MTCQDVSTLAQIFNDDSSSSPSSTLVETTPSVLDKLPPGLYRAIQNAGDRIVSKAAQLIQDETTNLSESYMSVRTKMDGGKTFNRIQSGSFEHRCMAAALRLQLGPGWIGNLWQRRFGTVGSLYLLQLGNSRKRKHIQDMARKTTEKYKRQRMMKRVGNTQRSDTSYGTNPVEPDVDQSELHRLCKEYVERLSVSPEEATNIAYKSRKQADDISGLWQSQRVGRITASHFGEVCKRKRPFNALTRRILYGKSVDTKAMRYGREHESIARMQYIGYLQSYSPSSSVEITGLHISVDDPWLGASPDALVYDPSVNEPEGLLEIKCPYKARETSLIDICTKKEYQPSSFCVTYNKRTDQFSLKKTHPYFYQIQGQLHITGRTWCDLFVWTPRNNDYIVLRIQADKKFWEVMRTKMWHFYTMSMLPELVSPRHLSGQKIRE